jgi:hypothetical protein
MKEFSNDKTHIVCSIIHPSDGLICRMITHFEKRNGMNGNFWREK